MIAYVISHLGPVLREISAPTPALPQITLSHTCHVGPVESTVHHVRRDCACGSGGISSSLCPGPALVQDRLSAGSQYPPGFPEDTWPESWATVPPLCPICGSPTLLDRYLNSRAGPGWRCTLGGYEHFWQVRMAPLRRYLAMHPPDPVYPWYDTPPEKRRAWLEAHSHPPRLVPSASSTKAMTQVMESMCQRQQPLTLDLPWPEAVTL
jgi:hypothetical protein